MNNALAIVGLVAVGSLLSCGGGAPPPMGMAKSRAESAPGARGGGTDQGEKRASAAVADGSGANTEQAPRAERKIVRSGDFSVTVKQLDPGLEAIEGRLRQLGGFVADTNVYRNPGTPPSARLVIKVPERDFDTAVAFLRTLGEVTSERVWTEDVTDQFYDLEARIGNQRKTEQRLITILEKQAGKLHEVLEVEREIARVRETLERYQGQMKVLASRIDLSTITVNLATREEYRAQKAATFGEKVSEMFGSSAGALVKFLTTIIFIIVAIIPWLSIPAALLVVVLVLKAVFIRKKT